MTKAQEEDRERLFGVFHNLGDMQRDELERNYSADNIQVLRDLITQHVLDCDLEPDLSAATFANFVLELRANERAWSRRLGEVIITAEDRLHAKDNAGAIAILDEYIRSCPWLPYKATAEIERVNLLA